MAINCLFYNFKESDNYGDRERKAREKAGPLYALFERVRSFIQMFEMVGGAIHK